MKNSLFILLLIPCLAMVEPNDNVRTITNAISNGDVETLSSYFDEKVEVAVLDDEDVYNKSEAKTIVKRFFSEHQPKNFNQVHQGTSKGQDSHYMIGNLNAGSATFRVYLYMKITGSDYVIQELRFDEE